MRLILPVLLAVLLSAAPSKAQEAGPGASADLAFQRQHTTNALDSPLALADWLTVIRGSLSNSVAHELGLTRFDARLEARRYDTYAIENDTRVEFATETTVRPSDRLELRGSLSWQHKLEGDDFQVDEVIVGISTPQNVLTGLLQAGIDLGHGWTLVTDATLTAERAGETRFEADLIAPTKINADYDRLTLGAALTRKRGALTLGGAGRLDLVHASPAPADPAAFSLTMQTLRTQAEWQGDKDRAVGASLGIQRLAGKGGMPTRIRPVYEIAFAQPLPRETALRGSLAAGHELLDTDDPLASWQRRAELELTARLMPAVTAGIGAFDEMRRNIALENRENARGAYARIDWQATGNLAFYARIEASRRRISTIDVEKKTLDTMVGLRTSL